jgi:hypothetical protein
MNKITSTWWDKIGTATVYLLAFAGLATFIFGGLWCLDETAARQERIGQMSSTKNQ